jgi:dipeptidase
MDLLRLALERSRTARQALDVITSLLDAHGQGGNCGFQHQYHHHNSFIIADPQAAWVLETAGPHWAAERVTAVRTIANGLTIGQHWDLASEALVSYAVERGWCQGRDDFYFADCYSDFTYTTCSSFQIRQRRTTALLQAQKGALTPTSIIKILRDHGPDAGPDWGPDHGLSDTSVCMHAGFGPLRAYQTTGSMVSHLAPDCQTYYVTGTAAPCTSIFKPVWLGIPLPDTGPAPSSSYDEATLFWRHETLHRATLRDYATRIQLYRNERDILERQFLAGAEAHCHLPLAERAAFATRCFAQADEAEANWTERVLAHPPTGRLKPLYALAWRNFNHSASD